MDGADSKRNVMSQAKDPAERLDASGEKRDSAIFESQGNTVSNQDSNRLESKRSSRNRSADRCTPDDASPLRIPKRVGLFGASSRGRQCLALLAGKEDFLPVCFFDNDPGKWGTKFENLPVVQPDAAQLLSVDVILVASMNAADIVSQLVSLGLSRRIAHDVPDLYLRFSGSIENPEPGKHEIAARLTDNELVNLVVGSVDDRARLLADRLIQIAPPNTSREQESAAVACTICCNNYLGMATTLAFSYLRSHPNSRFYLCLLGKRLPQLTYPDQLDDRIIVVQADGIGIDDFPTLAFCYDALELCCAVKPFFLEWVLANSNCREVLYLDPDIL